MKPKATIKFKPISELCFQDFYNQIKPQFKKILQSIKYERHDTFLNMNKGKSGKRITAIAQKTLKWYSKEKNQERISARRNDSGISPSFCCQILKKDLCWYPYKVTRHHHLKGGVHERCPCFCQWFLHQ